MNFYMKFVLSEIPLDDELRGMPMAFLMTSIQQLVAVFIFILFLLFSRLTGASGASYKVKRLSLWVYFSRRLTFVRSCQRFCECETLWILCNWFPSMIFSRMMTSWWERDSPGRPHGSSSLYLSSALLLQGTLASTTLAFHAWLCQWISWFDPVCLWLQWLGTRCCQNPFRWRCCLGISWNHWDSQGDHLAPRTPGDSMPWVNNQCQFSEHVYASHCFRLLVLRKLIAVCGKCW